MTMLAFAADGPISRATRQARCAFCPDHVGATAIVVYHPTVMSCFHKRFTLRTTRHDEIVDITAQVRDAVRSSGIRDGACTVYAAHATAAITINENDDPNVGVDFLRALGMMVKEHDGWLHDRVDDNAASHIKSALVGPSETIPIVDGELQLGTWQNVFFCEFDGPRATRNVIVTVVG